MKSQKKKKILVLIAIIVFICLGIGGFLLFKNKNTTNNENAINEQINDTQKQDSDKTGYDFIVDLMAEPEFWGVEDVPIYSYNSKEYREMLSKNYPEEDNSVSPERNKAIEAMPNGSGWKLIDEDTATFTRGYEGRLTYNFSEFKAIVESDWLYTTEWDFNTNTERLYESKTDHTLVKERPFKDCPNDLSEDEAKDYIGNLYEEEWFVKNSMLNYEAQFKAAECPLVNQPKGTLTSYKNKMSKVITRDDYYLNNTSYKPHQDKAFFETVGYEDVGILDSQKFITAPWQQPDYVWDYTKNTNLIWLDDYREILTLIEEIPDTELIAFNGGPGYYNADGTPGTMEMLYSCSYLAFCNLKEMSMFQDLENAKTINDISMMFFYPNKATNFLAYYVRPILKECYGVDAVYFCDSKQLKGNNQLVLGMSDSEFVSASKHGENDEIVGVEKYLMECNESRIGNVWEPSLWGDVNGDYDYLIDCMKSTCAKTNTPYMYSDTFLLNYFATVDMDIQRDLGLR